MYLTIHRFCEQFLTKLWVFSFFLFAAGCQTTKVLEQAQIPISIQPYFSGCAGDGSALWRIELDDQGAAEVEWVLESPKKWEFRALDPVGRMKLQVRKEYHEFIAAGPLAAALPDLHVGEDGFLVIDQHWVAIRGDELACILKRKFPQLWMSEIFRLDSTNDQYEVHISEKERKIQIKINRDSSNEQVCAKFSWRLYLGLMGRALEVCHYIAGKQVRGNLNTEGMQIRWMVLDES